AATAAAREDLLALPGLQVDLRRPFGEGARAAERRAHVLNRDDRVADTGLLPGVLEQHRRGDVLDVRLDFVHVSFGQVDLAAADQPLLRSLAVAVLEETPQETQRVEMHLLPCAKSASRQTVDGTLELAERPALIEVLAGGDDRADVVRLVAHEVAAGLPRPRAVPRIVRTVD